MVGPVAGGHSWGLREVTERGLLLPGEYEEQMRCREEASQARIEGPDETVRGSCPCPTRWASSCASLGEF